MPDQSSQLVLRVGLNLPIRKTFDYCLPEGWLKPAPQPGVRLKVPFAGKELIGILLEVHTNQPSYDLKPILLQIDDEPILDHHILQLLNWSANYYCHPVGEVIATALPAHLKQGKQPLPRLEHRWTLGPAAQQTVPQLSKAPKQQAILNFLSDQPQGASDTELNAQFTNWRSPMKALVDKRLVMAQASQVTATEAVISYEEGHQLNAAQQTAFDRINSQLNQYACFLLYGVTGSGKTEVYLQLVRRTLMLGKQALLLVPEIGLTPQLVSRFQTRFSSGIVVIHSGLSDSDRSEAWRQAKSGEAKIIIGTRSAVFTPMQSPGVIIVDEEHDASFKQMEGFRYSARDIAIKRASMLNIPVLLGSATPAIESFNNVSQGRFTLLQLPERTGESIHPEMTLLDLRGKKPVSGLSQHAIKAIADELERGGQALIFLNRRGYAPMLRCEDCGWVAECHHCDVRLTLHRRDARLRCHVCSYETRVPTQCPSCDSESLHTIGQGTEKLEAILQQHFPENEVIRVDRDTTRARGSFSKILDRVNSGKSKILIGTQMLAKGHHFPEIGTVIVLDADNGLYGLDFRSQEHMAQLVTQVAGRAGRSKRPGKVYIQTWHPEHPFFEALRNLPYIEMASRMLNERKVTGMPPYSHLALLRAESVKMNKTEEFIQISADAARQIRSSAIELLGPAVAPLERKAGHYRMQILVKSENRADLHAFLTKWIAHLDSIKTGRMVRWSVDIDPYHLY